MASIAHDLLPTEATLPTNRQRLFLLFFMGTLVDLVIFGLYDEYSSKVYVAGFGTLLVASVLMQALLKATIIFEHRVLARFKGKTGAGWKTLKYFTAWLILFGSKFVILEALSFAFDKDVHFSGAFHGIVWLILVAFTMVIAEELIARLYRRMA